MSMYGANADQLDQLARSFMSAGDMLARTERSLTSHLHASPWHGRDATEFRADWSRSHRRVLVDTVSFLHDGAARLRDHATAQRRASAAGGGAISAVTSPAAAGSFATPSVRPSRLGPRRERIEVYEFRIGANIPGTDFGVERDVAFRLERLSDGSYRVVELDLAGATAGLGVSAGIDIDTGDSGWRAGGSLSASAALLQGRGETHRFDSLADAERYMAATASAAAVTTQLPLVGGLLGSITDRVTHARPESEAFVVSSRLDASVGRQLYDEFGVEASVAEGVSFVRYDDGSVGLRHELSGSAAASVKLRGWEAEGEVAGAGSMELVRHPDGRVELRMEVLSSAGDRATMTEASFDLAGLPEATFAQLARGDVRALPQTLLDSVEPRITPMRSVDVGGSVEAVVGNLHATKTTYEVDNAGAGGGGGGGAAW